MKTYGLASSTFYLFIRFYFQRKQTRLYISINLGNFRLNSIQTNCIQLQQVGSGSGSGSMSGYHYPYFQHRRKKMTRNIWIRYKNGNEWALTLYQHYLIRGTFWFNRLISQKSTRIWVNVFFLLDLVCFEDPLNFCSHPKFISVKFSYGRCYKCLTHHLVVHSIEFYSSISTPKLHWGIFRPIVFSRAREQNRQSIFIWDGICCFPREFQFALAIRADEWICTEASAPDPKIRLDYRRQQFRSERVINANGTDS